MQPPVNTQPGTCSKDGQHICYNCAAAPYCVKLPNGLFLNAGIINCTDLDTSKPYCTDGVCSATPTDECIAQTPISNFTCTSDGYFPDPDDCQTFHFCVGIATIDYSCSDNYVYSHKKNACIRKKVSSDCAVIKCTYKSLVEYVLYPKDPNVYGLCIRGNPTVVLKCGEGEKFDTKTSTCNFVCKKEGLFPVPGEPRKYRECIAISSTKFELVLTECPDATEFDPVKERCVIEKEN